MKQMHAAWWVAGMLSAALHVLALWPVQPSVARASGSFAAIHVRQIASPDRLTPIHDAHVASRRSAERSLPDASAPAHPPPPIGPQPRVQPSTPQDTNTSDSDEYLPRSVLTRGPEALQPVFVPYPDTAPAGTWRTVLTLFIDDAGRVRRVRAGSGDLPPALEDAARQAFLQAPYTPGEVQGQPVKARVRIEVEFSATPTLAPAS